MVQEWPGFPGEATARDRAEAWPEEAFFLMFCHLVRDHLLAASVLAGNENAVHDALHAVAALGSTALAFRELGTAIRADKISLKILENGGPEGFGADRAVEGIQPHGDTTPLGAALSLWLSSCLSLLRCTTVHGQEATSASLLDIAVTGSTELQT